MKKQIPGRGLPLTVFFLFCLLTMNCLSSTDSHAKVYIDITEPAFRRLPISISATGHEKSMEIISVVKDDLDFTGIFYPIDPEFPGAEIKITVHVQVPEKIEANVAVFDVIENKRVLNKKYTASEKILRALAHSIANDIYEVVTGNKGVFRTKVSYIGSLTQKKQLYLTDWDGYNPVRIVAKGLSLSHSWSPDGTRIVYSSERKRQWGVYELNLKNYSERTLFVSKEGLNLVGGISPDNRLAFSSSKGGNPEIYTMHMGGGGLKKITRSFGIDVSPVFSPDGSQIAFVSDRGGSPQIYTMEASGREPVRMTFEGSYNTSPSWSPDGRWIAYVGRKHGKNQIFMIQSDGTEIRQITYEGNNESPAFSPDGMFLAFDSDREGKKGIYLLSFQSEQQRRITPKEMWAMNPKWSPYLK